MGTCYNGDLVAWAREQATLLREGNWSALDIEHIAEEIEDVGRSEQRELRRRMSVLLAHLLKWQFQVALRGKSWLGTVQTQRARIAKKLKKMPSLKTTLSDADWFEEAWEDAVELAKKETGLAEFPVEPVWTVEQVLDPGFLPD